MKVLFAVLLSVLSASAQGSGYRPDPHPDPRLSTGVVAGTVTCSDTNLPGRLTDISLTPVRESAPPTDPQTGKPQPEPMIRLYQTHLDGTFLIPRVAPGRYYVIAQKPGYFSPAALFTKAQMDDPSTPELARQIAEQVPSVTVAPGRTVTLSLQLHRAASVSGTLRFDDGSPASLLSVSFARRNPDGKWVRVALSGGSGRADDLGHFRASGLPAGEYRMETSLSVSELHVSTVFSDFNGGMWMSNGTNLPIYFGDTFFRKDARTLKLDDGQDATADMTIPISKLHSVSGSLVDARTGKVLNAGKIDVLEPGGTDVLTSVNLDDEDPAFRLEYVPEGTYTVRVSNARLVNRQLEPKPPGYFGTPSYKETELQSYDFFEGPLIVTTDMQAVNLPMTPHTGKPQTP